MHRHQVGGIARIDSLRPFRRDSNLDEPIALATTLFQCVLDPNAEQRGAAGFGTEKRLVDARLRPESTSCAMAVVDRVTITVDEVPSTKRLSQYDVVSISA